MATKKDYDSAKIVWDLLGDIPVNEDDELDEDFVIDDNTIFSKGTEKLEVWIWIEERYNISIAKLMGLQRHAKTLEDYKKSAEEDYLHVPISVLRYISKLEEALEQSEQLENF